MSVADPCDPIDGDFSTSISVFAVVGNGIQPSLTLHYDSMLAQNLNYTKNTGGDPGLFGNGWTTTWNTTLSFTYDPGTHTCGIYVNQYNGLAVAFTVAASGTQGTSNACILGPGPVDTFTAIAPGTFGQTGSPDGAHSTIDTRVHLKWTGSAYILSYDYSPATGTGSENYIYSQTGQLLSARDAVGESTQVVYHGSTITVTGIGGTTFTLTLNGAGQVSRATNSLGQSASFTYSGVGDLVSYSDPNGAVTKYEYSSGDHLITRWTDPSGGVHGNVWGQGPLIFPADNNQTAFEVVPVVSQTDPMGRTTTLCYYGSTGSPYSGNETACPVLDASDIVSPETKAALATDVIGPTGDQTLFTYRSDGLDIASITTGFIPAVAGLSPMGGATWVYKYEACGSFLLEVPCQVIDPNGHSQSFEYDGTGNVIGYSDPNGSKWTYGYDQYSDLVSINPPAGPPTLYSYDPTGRIASVTTGDCGNPNASSITTFSYRDPSNPELITDVTDANGGVTEYRYNPAGDVTAVVDPKGAVSTYAYDAQGNLISSTDPSGNGAVAPPQPTAALVPACQPLSAPRISGVSPPVGPANSAGLPVTITGADFTLNSAVDFGPDAAAVVSFSSTQLVVLPPSEKAGTVDVTVTSAQGISATSPADAYTYYPPPTITKIAANTGPVSGGNTVTITGTNFIPGHTTVSFGTIAATSVSVSSSTQLSATVPPASLSSSTGIPDAMGNRVFVSVDVAGVTTPSSLAALYFYGGLPGSGPAPVISAVFPNFGVAGASVKILIDGPVNNPVVFFGNVPATVTGTSQNLIVVTVPVGNVFNGSAVAVSIEESYGFALSDPNNSTFYYGNPPAVQITSYGPRGGGAGTQFKIVGQNLTSLTSLTFGGVPANNLECIPTLCIAGVPAYTPAMVATFIPQAGGMFVFVSAGGQVLGGFEYFGVASAPAGNPTFLFGDPTCYSPNFSQEPALTQPPGSPSPFVGIAGEAGSSPGVNVFESSLAGGAVTRSVGYPYATGAAPYFVAGPIGCPKVLAATGHETAEPIEYLVDNVNNLVDPINVVSGTPLAPIPTGTSPVAMAVTADSRYGLVANFGSGTVTPVDLSNDTAARGISVCGKPSAVVATPDASLAYVSCAGDDSLIPLKLSGGVWSPQPAISLGRLSPLALAISPDGANLYVSGSSSSGSGQVDVVSTATAKMVGAPISVGSEPSSIAVLPTGTKVYVSNWGSDSVSVISTLTESVASTITLSYQPFAVGLSYSGSEVLVSAYKSDNTILQIDPGTDTLGPPLYLSSMAPAPIPPPFSCSSSGGPAGPCLPLSKPENPPPPAGCAFTTPGSSSGLDGSRHGSTVLRRRGTARHGSSSTSLSSRSSKSVRRNGSGRIHGAGTGGVGSGRARGEPGSDRPPVPSDVRNVSLYMTSNATVESFDLIDCRANSPISTGGSPGLVVASSDGHELYVVDFASGTVQIVDTHSGKVTDTIALGRTYVSAPNMPAVGDAVLSKDGSILYVVGGLGTRSIIPVDLRRDSVGKAIPAGTDPIAIALSSDGTTAWVANVSSSQITPVDLTDATNGAPIHVCTQPVSLLFDPHSAVTASSKASRSRDDNASGTIWVACYGDGTVVPVNSSDGTPGSAIAVGADPVSIAAVLGNPGNGTGHGAGAMKRSGHAGGGGASDDMALVAAQGSGQLLTLDLAMGKVAASIPVSLPGQVVVTDKGSTAYVASPQTSSIQIVDLESDTVRASMPTSEPVAAVALAQSPTPRCDNSNSAARGGAGSPSEGSCGNENGGASPTHDSQLNREAGRRAHGSGVNLPGQTTYAYDKAGRLTQVVGPPPAGSLPGAVTNYVYDANGNLTSVVDPDGKSTSATYDLDNEVTSMTTGSGSTQSVTNYQYDQAGNVISQKDGAGDVTAYAYGDSSNPSLVTAATDPLGNVSTYRYDPGGNLTSVLDPLSRLTNIVYDAADQVSSVTYEGQQQVPHSTHTAKQGARTSGGASGGAPCLMETVIAGQSICSFTAPAGQTTDPPTTWSIDHVSTAPASVFWGLSCWDANDCVAAGASNMSSGATPNPLVSATHDGGKTWSDVTLPGNGELLSIECPSVTSCIADGGFQGAGGSPTVPIIVTTSDGGATWVSQVPPAGVNGVGGGVSCTSPTSCIAMVTDITAFGGGGVIQTADGGVTWKLVYSNPMLDLNPYSHSTCPSSNECLFTGVEVSQAGSTFDLTAESVVTTDGGVTWDVHPMGAGQPVLGAATINDPIGITCSSPSQCLVTGTAFTTSGSKATPTALSWTSADGGNTWISTSPRFTEPPGIGTGLFGVSCSGASCVATGNTYSLVGSSDQINGPLIAVSSDGGTNWTQEAAPVPVDPSLTSGLVASDCLSPTTCFASGAQGSSASATFSFDGLVIRGSSPPKAFSQVSYTYDVTGRRASMTDSTGTTTYSYDPLGHLSHVADGTGSTVSYSYDKLGDESCVAYPISTTATCSAPPSPSNTVVDYSFDKRGEMTSLTDWKGDSFSFGYDGVGRLITAGYPQPYTGATLSYNGAGTLTTLNDALFNVAGLSTNLAAVAHESWTSDASALLTGSSLMVGGPAFSNNWVTTKSGFSYDSSNRLASASIGGSSIAYAYDSANRLASIAGGISSQTLSYNAGSEICGLGASAVSCPANPSTPSSADRSFTFDALGNRLSQTSASGSGSLGAAGGYTFGYDQQGTMTCLDPASSSPCGGPASYRYNYNGDGLRTDETTPTGSTGHFTYNESGPIPQVLTDSTTGLAFIYGPPNSPLGSAPLEQISLAGGGSTSYLLSDPTGVRAEFTSTSIGTATYDAWGNCLSCTNMTSPFGYQGVYTDPTGFQYLINRYYDAATGQFVSVDPLVGVTGAAYGYAGNDPVNNSDPLGLCSWWNPWCDLTGGIADLGNEWGGYTSKRGCKQIPIGMPGVSANNWNELPKDRWANFPTIPGWVRNNALTIKYKIVKLVCTDKCGNKTILYSIIAQITWKWTGIVTQVLVPPTTHSQ